MARKYTRHTDEFRASVVLMLQAAGYPDKKGALAKVARNVGVSYSTISRWYRKVDNPAPVNIVQRKKIDLVQAIRDEMQAALNEMSQARQDASYRDLGVVVGILADKHQLLTGEATERVESKQIVFQWQEQPEVIDLHADDSD